MTAPDTYYLDAAKAVLDNLQEHDLWFPQVGAAASTAWATHFEASTLSSEELLDGVNHARATHIKTAATRAEQRGETVEQFRPTPDIIIRHAHAARREVLANLPDARVKEMELANHVFQDMGFPPQQAHRLSRDIALAVALGRKPRADLTDEQLDEFQTRFKRQKLSAAEFVDRRRELAQMLRVGDLFALEARRGDAA